jgi:hypothetical protein
LIISAIELLQGLVMQCRSTCFAFHITAHVHNIWPDAGTTFGQGQLPVLSRVLMWRPSGLPVGLMSEVTGSNSCHFMAYIYSYSCKNSLYKVNCSTDIRNHTEVPKIMYTHFSRGYLGYKHKAEPKCSVWCVVRWSQSHECQSHFIE